MLSASAARLPIERLISSVASRVSCASFLTSAATTEKARPASPARAASIVALSASMLVVLAIPSIAAETVRTCSITVAKFST